MSSTIYDIAREAEVSIATVSRVFNNSSSVTRKTREKVLAVAENLGYHPRALAQSLARKKTKIITVIVPVISNYFFMEVLAGMQDKIADYDYDLQIFNVKIADDLLNQADHIMKRGWGEGYVVISVHLADSEWELLDKYNVPVVLIDEYYPGFDTISVDSIEGAYTATSHLIEQGYTSIGMICAKPDSKPIIDRRLGYRRAMEDAGLLVDPGLIVTGDDMERDGFTENNGYQAMTKLIQNKQPPQACFCASDIQALGAIKAMRDNNVKIPVIGFDDLEFSEYVGLSTMRQPMYEMGALAIEKMVKRLEEKQSDITHTVFSPDLVLRTSSPDFAGITKTKDKPVTS
ncbi:LacI family DNA-binding transcriptional regulator [Natronogracilivirga saccharolytica]|uniref:LacI family DNA-binding transcriptional regulator n=1 Tax=Natronogracilivirga saccharolytica TaxID=2812953 RepID=A0A8J7UU76_9BACT|nr:LacI family DNA-binding transcriptional regulator [Natronogracilivirga saccharolytica]MBP3191207.1 LacI family DNA-binding transcriptional regulator [Natronogracilivirga saccharolytica]